MSMRMCSVSPSTSVRHNGTMLVDSHILDALRVALAALSVPSSRIPLSGWPRSALQSAPPQWRWWFLVVVVDAPRKNQSSIVVAKGKKCIEEGKNNER